MNKKHQTLSKPSKIIKSDDLNSHLEVVVQQPQLFVVVLPFHRSQKNSLFDVPTFYLNFLPPNPRRKNLQLLLFLGRTLWTLVSPVPDTLHRLFGSTSGLNPPKKTPKNRRWQTWNLRGPLKLEGWRAPMIPTIYTDRKSLLINKLNATFLKNSRKGLHGFTKRHSQVRSSLCDAMMQLYIPLCELCVTINHQNKHQHQRTSNVPLWESVLQYYSQHTCIYI